MNHDAVEHLRSGVGSIFGRRIEPEQSGGEWREECIPGDPTVKEVVVGTLHPVRVWHPPESEGDGGPEIALALAAELEEIRRRGVILERRLQRLDIEVRRRSLSRGEAPTSSVATGSARAITPSRIRSAADPALEAKVVSRRFDGCGIISVR